MTSPGIKLSVIVPAYNEAERIGKTLERLHSYLTHASSSYEILVVVDGARDRTLDVVREIAQRIPEVRVIERTVNRGKGYTVKEGMLAARGEIRLFSDADNSTDIAHFEQMEPLFNQGYDVVIASRNANDAGKAEQALPQALYKRIIGRFGNRIVQLVAVPGIWDTQCGFKAFRAAAAERIFSQTTVERWGFDIEVLALARALHYRIGIIPAHWVNDERSHVRLLDYLRVLADTFSVRRNFLAGKYDC
ncbi:MAG TPA: dolichyl-phosphate beta-glucosyltransferase [Acidobacteriota bacterium]|nr:dolichyl-phosphate beta-glucosyltransferase [Acidobacteriota bacterium]